MDYRTLFSLNAKKLLVIVILFVLGTLPGMIPPLTDPMGCVRIACDVFIGLPLIYLTAKISQGILTNISFNFFNVAIDIIIFYLITAILFYLFRRRENVPNSDTGRRDLGGPDQIGYGNREGN